MQPAAVLNILVRANTAQATAALGRTDAQLKKTAATAKGSSAGMGAVIAKGAKVGGLAVAALGIASVKAASDFQSSFAEVRKTVDTSERGFKRIERGIRNMAKEIPVGTTELNNLAGQAGALGIKSKDILRFTRTAAELGITTDMSADEAANALARLANIMGTSGKDFRRLASTFVELGNKGASTEAEISEMALRIAGAGKTLGLTEAQVLGLSSALANVGINAEAGGSAISRAMLQMSDSVAKGGDQLDAFAKISGLTATQFARQFQADAPRAIAIFAAGLSKVAKEGGSVSEVLKGVGLNEIRVRDALLRIGANTQQFSNAQRVANKEWKTNTALTEEARKRYETFSSRLTVLKNNLVDMGISIGNELLPHLSNAVQWLTRFIRQMDSGKGKGGEFAAALKDIWPVVRTLFIWFGKAAGAVISWQRITSKSIRAIGDFFTNVWNRPKKAFGDLLASILRGFAKLFDAASHLPGVGNKFKDLAAKARRSANQVDQLGEEIDRLPSKKQVKVQVDMLLKDFGAGNVPKLVPPGQLGKGDGWGLSGKIDRAVAGKVQAGVKSGRIDPFGLGPIGPLGMGSAGAVDAFTPFASRFGLSMTSGFRPGSITSSGNLSLHALNRARDYADGAGPMLAFAQFMASKFGGRLSELIHTPMGFSIKNGQRVAPYAQADHYDHVHVALAKGGTARKKVRALVGEQGPEIVDLPVGARVHSFSKSKRMAAQMGGLLPGFAAGGFVDGVSSSEALPFAKAVWRRAKGLTGSSASMPKILLGAQTTLGRFSEYRPTQHAVPITRDMQRALADPKHPLHSYAKRVLLHEFAHAMQPYSVLSGPVWEREGGAEVWAKWAANRIYGGKLGRYRDYAAGYPGRSARVRQEKSRHWWRLGQFISTRIAKASGGRLPSVVGAPGSVVARAAYAAGFRGSLLQRMVAEAGGESTWNERAVGDGGASKGLWQIHLPSHPWARGLNLFDPFVNARAAKRVYDSQGIGAWHADHTPWIGKAAAAIQSMGRGGGGGARRGGSRGTVTGGGRGPKEAFVGSGLTLADRITKAQGVLEAAEATGVLDDDTAARGELIGLHRTRAAQIRTRLRKINKALGGRKASVAARRRLGAERSTLLGELNTTRGEIRSLGAPLDAADDPAAEASRLAAEAANRLADEIAALRAESKQLADRQEYLVNRQGPQLVAALTMALSGNMGRAAALGRRTPAAAGRTASL